MDVELGNSLVRFSIEVWTTVCQFPISADGFYIFVFGEHPEDLGAVVREEDRLKMTPASIHLERQPSLSSGKARWRQLRKAGQVMCRRLDGYEGAENTWQEGDG